MQRKIGVFFTRDGGMGYPFNKAEYLQSYKELAAAVSELGGSFYIVREQSSYLGSGAFSTSWQFDVSGEGQEVIETGPITLDVIYDKGPFKTDGKVKVLNSVAVNEVCTDKWKTYQLFSKNCPKTILVESTDFLHSALDQIDTRLKVVKPRDGAEGLNVHIGTSEEILNVPAESMPYPLLVQSFLDSTQGLPGFTQGIHDFRIALLNGEIVYAFLRTPPEGGLKANVALGGTLKVVAPEDIPPMFLAIAQEVDSVMKEFGNRVYGVDMALTPEGPKIIELNSSLGLQENTRHPVFVAYKQKLAQLFMDM